MTPQEPVRAEITGELLRIRNSRSVEETEERPAPERPSVSEQSLQDDQLLSELGQVKTVLGETQAYTAYLEAEVARKNAALNDLEGRINRLEAEQPGSQAIIAMEKVLIRQSSRY